MRNNTTTKKQICDYWMCNSDIDESNLNFDWVDSDCHCWNCGIETKSLERAHIIPHSLGGEDTADNYVLLCHACHNEAPNLNDKDIMWEWIKSNKKPISLTKTYRVIESVDLFNMKENKSFITESKKINDIKRIIEGVIKETSVHGTFYNTSTMYYVLRKIINNGN